MTSVNDPKEEKKKRQKQRKLDWKMKRWNKRCYCSTVQKLSILVQVMPFYPHELLAIVDITTNDLDFVFILK